MLKKTVLLLLGVFLAVTTVQATERVIIFATDATWPPMEFVDANKKITGFSVDYMTAAGKEAGFTPKFMAVAWDGIFAGLDVAKY
ncbi:MAG: transporter substrate-binding domain-containing protein, partial [Deltaproteobacteria bacterium]|nr:transporter substrate-binding domain-containing protein [Deltaproteobacteria bacterium]